jgi:hypothetical protein
MTDFIAGKIDRGDYLTVNGEMDFDEECPSVGAISNRPTVASLSSATSSETSPSDSAVARNRPTRVELTFTPRATAVFNAARELWKYYHSQKNHTPSASHPPLYRGEYYVNASF